MKLNKIQKEILRKLGNFLLPRALSVLCTTLKIELENDAPFKENGKNFVLAFWHGKMVAGWYLLKNRNQAALISSSKDGDLLARLLGYWNYELARGSSSAGGKEALEKIVHLAEAGFNVAITPDGPKGPAKKMKAGCVIAAKKSGIPLLLAGIGYSDYWELKSWDKLRIPKPFSKVAVRFSDSIIVEKHLSYEETSQLINEAENLLNNLDTEAERIVKHN